MRFFVFSGASVSLAGVLCLLVVSVATPVRADVFSEAKWEIEDNIKDTCQRSSAGSKESYGACTRRQWSAVAVLRKDAPSDIPTRDFDSARARCEKLHPADYSARVRCETREFNEIRAAKADKKS
jgi:hypothetical protein